MGVQELCRVLGIVMATEWLAIGDEENDLELVCNKHRLVLTWSVQQAEGVNLVLDETNNEGGAIALFGFGAGTITRTRLLIDPYTKKPNDDDAFNDRNTW